MSAYFPVVSGGGVTEERLLDQTFNIGVTAAVPGDLAVAFTSQACTFDKRGKWVDVAGAPSFTLTYTSTAWAASTAYAVGNRRLNGGNVYEVTTAGTSASSGGPTGTGTGIVDGSVTWSYVSPATSGAFMFTGLPYTADPTFRFYLNCVPSAPLTFGNNGTALYLAPIVNTNTANLIASKSAGTAQASQVSTGQLASGVAYTLPFSGRYKAAA